VLSRSGIGCFGFMDRVLFQGYQGAVLLGADSLILNDSEVFLKRLPYIIIK